jgi:ribosome-associated translation inhibitor RaiA
MRAQESLTVHLRMRWLDFSPALHHYATRRIEVALRRFATRIRRVNVLIADANGPRRSADDRRCEIEVLLHPAGSLTVSATASDPYLSVDRAVRRARAIVRGHIAREREHRVPAELTRIV